MQLNKTLNLHFIYSSDILSVMSNNILIFKTHFHYNHKLISNVYQS